MNNSSTPEPQSSLSLDDIYYILFRHKWKILICSLLGFAAAGTFLLVHPLPYMSEARLMIRYVLDESSTVNPVGSSGSKVRTPDERGDSIINSEIEILTSFDLAKSVAETLGPEKILGKGGGKSNAVLSAAVVVANGLEVDAGKKDSVIRVIFKHKDPEIVQSVLQEVVDSYIRKHLDVHQTGGALDDFLTRKTDELRNQLTETEKELRDRRNSANVVSIEESRKNCIEREAKLNLDLLAAQTELTERTASFNMLTKNAAAPVTNTNQPAVNTASPAQAVNVAATADTTNTEIPPAAIDEYKRYLDRLDSLWKNYSQLRSQFTEENKFVKDARKQIQDATAERQKLEKQYPRLLSLNQPQQAPRPNIIPATALSPSSTSGIDITAESTHIVGLQSKVNFLQAQLGRIHVEITNLNAIEPTLVELERKRAWEETNYHYFEVRREQSRINESLGMGKVSNIGKVQSPTPPVGDSKKAMKIVAGLSFGGIALGVVLAFLIEMVLDPCLKRSKDVENKAKFRLFLTVPAFDSKMISQALETTSPKALLSEHTSADSTSPQQKRTNQDALTAPWDEEHALHPYYEALRDRIVNDFEQRNLTHKPKLVAVTSCSHGSGVTTMSIGLAAALSKIGDSNVLLVDMNLQGGAAQQFYKGKPDCNIDDALNNQSRESALVHENLYVVTGRISPKQTNGKTAPDGLADLSQRMFPRNFATMVPKLHASNYDYIIFDMPPISQTSIATRMAKLMDLNLVVIESEKTSTESAKRVASLMTDLKAQYSAVLNKTRAYVPQRLNHELS